MRFLVDESTGAPVAAWLTSQGHDAVFAGAVLRGAPDEHLLAFSVETDRILITNDKDFGEWVIRWGVRTPGSSTSGW